MTASILSYPEEYQAGVVDRRLEGMNGGTGYASEQLVGTPGGIGTLAALDARRKAESRRWAAAQLAEEAQA